MLSRDEVIAAYIHLLGREPENEEAIAHHRKAGSLAHLRRTLLQSEEFAEQYRQIADHDAGVLSVDPVLSPPRRIETEARGAQRAEMWARVAENWRRLGEEAPHWSVLTFEKFRPESLAENAVDFGETAASDMALVDAALARLPEAAALRAGECLELGCGVGRITRGLAERFASVRAVDVSAPHLEIARRNLAGCPGVSLSRIERIEDYAALGHPSFFYSRIVLQHNPPPVQAAMLRAVLGSLASPGAALFQIITHIDGYTFDVSRYLGGSHAGMEMHALPQEALFAILSETGMDPVEVERGGRAAGDDSRYRSHVVLARKKLT